MEFEFPFEVPADLKALDAGAFAAFQTQVRTFAQSTLADEASTPEALVATRELFALVATEDTRRTTLATAAAAARTELAAGLAPVLVPAVVEPVTVTEPVTVVEPVTVTEPVAVVASTGTATATLDVVPETVAPVTARLIVGNDSPNVGAEIGTFGEVGEIINRRLGNYSSSSGKRKGVKTLNKAGTKVVINGRNMVRHSNVSVAREFPADLRITDGGAKPMAVLEHAMDEYRLPGGNLRNSAAALIKSGKALTAAVGWCAPSEIIYDLCMLETREGILDLPEIQASRGGFQIPIEGGPDFSVIWDSIGDDGDVILTEYDVEQGTDKVCTIIPCPPFEDVRLDVAYLCLTGSLLQSRGYPEAVTRFTQGALIALDHKVNQSVISRIAAASTQAGTIPTITGSDDAASQLLSAIEVAIEDIKYRNRMGRATTMEIVLPAWVIAPIRAALARRRGTGSWNVSDAEILAAFTTRNAVPRFVYDWQDAYSGLSGGPGAATPILEFPDTVSFLAYPAGTWVKGVRDVINLDTVYDNAMLTENQYTALFTEDGFSVMQMCVDSRLYTVGIDPAGIVGCCS